MGASPGGSEWLEPLVDAISAAADEPDELGALFAQLQTELGEAEAGRRWWAAFGASDASAT